jgi:hypothetical protein
MAAVKKQSILPGGDENGLLDIAPQLVAEGANRAPKKLRAVIGIVDCRRVGIDSDTGEEVATVRWRRVEVLLNDDLGQAEKLVRRALEARSGQTTLPLELEDDIRQAFKDMTDPDSPEDPDDGPDDPEDGKRKRGGK